MKPTHPEKNLLDYLFRGFRSTLKLSIRQPTKKKRKVHSQARGAEDIQVRSTKTKNKAVSCGQGLPVGQLGAEPQSR